MKLKALSGVWQPEEVRIKKSYGVIKMAKRKPVPYLEIEHFTGEIEKAVNLIENIPPHAEEDFNYLTDFGLALLRGVRENLLKATYCRH